MGYETEIVTTQKYEEVIRFYRMIRLHTEENHPITSSVKDFDLAEKSVDGI